MSNQRASLAHAIRTFQNGGLSHKEFFAQVDQALASDRGNSAQLFELLDDEHTRVQLPPEVYAELQRRVAHLQEMDPSSANETRLQTSPHDHMRPRPPPVPHANDYPNEPAEIPERIKGVGDTLNGRFVLEECIGFGGMGTVYKALDLRKLEASDRNPYIAIKVLNVQFRGHPKSLIALQREAKKAQALAHPNIVTVYDFDRDGSMVYLTMEYLAGKPLSRTLRDPDFKGMPYDKALHIVSGVAKALAYAHERGFVHCDLKPANIILADKGEVKVIDFGIARVFQKPEEDAEATVFDPGSLGAMTPAYASPEMLEHRVPDPRDDVYALACITYELLTGRHPFDRLSATQARNAGLKPQRPKNLGYRQWRALRAALAFERDARTRNVERFLREFSAESPAQTPLVLGALGLLVAALAAVAFNYDRQPADGPVVSQPPAQVVPKLSLDAVAPILARVPCSALVPSIGEDALRVQGYLPASYGVARLQEDLRTVSGVRALALDVQQVSDEKCPVIRMLGPYWIKTRETGSAASIQLKKPGAVLTEGEFVVLDVTTPTYDSFVYVDYYAFDGNVLHMLPSPHAKANQAPPNYAATIGSLGNWVVAKPFGTDLIVLLVTPAPLFEELRPEHEPTADYLTAVEKQLRQQSGKFGAEKIAVEFLQITTRGRKS